MSYLRSITMSLCVCLLAGGCAIHSPDGVKGPTLVSSGRSTETGQYAELGVRFTTPGDFVALFSPERWANPVATGGSLSWINPDAWREDAGRTGRILLGEAALIGGVAAAVSGGGGSSGGSGVDSGQTSAPPPPGDPIPSGPTSSPAPTYP